MSSSVARDEHNNKEGWQDKGRGELDILEGKVSALGLVIGMLLTILQNTYRLPPNNHKNIIK